MQCSGEWKMELIKQNVANTVGVHIYTKEYMADINYGRQLHDE